MGDVPLVVPTAPFLQPPTMNYPLRRLNQMALSETILLNDLAQGGDNVAVHKKAEIVR
jgi:hypothetical protein